ncbi:MAG TPA: glycosyltransferase family 1 protein, partial [Thermoanaerobaculia bacterium]|nr:glycosyltransferase family 1 protein [Thermoanaerobaculia bacterium]
MSRLIFLTGTPASVAEGSGTWVGITVLKAALEALGHEVTLVRPRRGAKGAVLSRLAFNLELYERLQEMKADAVVGFDLDGFLTGGDGPLHVAAIKGVLADEAAHENGASRVALGAQALLEGWHVRHADRVVTSSVYSAERIAAFY